MIRGTRGFYRAALFAAAGTAVLLFAAVALAVPNLSIQSHNQGLMTWVPGDFVNGGFQFWLSKKNSVPVTVQVTGTVDIPVHCDNPHGPLAPGSPISVPVSIAPFTIPANSRARFLTADTSSILVWMGAVASPDLCGGQTMYLKGAATFNAVVTSSAHVGDIKFRFHYLIPAAKKHHTRPNTNCTNASDPNRDQFCRAPFSDTKSV